MMEEYINYMIGLYVIEEYMNLKLYSVYDWFIKHLVIDILKIGFSATFLANGSTVRKGKKANFR